VNWLKHGDFNSKFVHSAIRWRRLKNEVKGVEVDSQWCEEPEVVSVGFNSAKVLEGG